MLLKLFKTIWSAFFSIGVLVVIYVGWIFRDYNYLSAETGAGYILGIVGSSFMLILLVYPLSKRVASLTRIIPIRYWFGFHMLLGVVGPVMILFHANFRVGSTNSLIALTSMLLVAGSGVVGRYFYTRIHHGLYGTQLTLKELGENTENDHAELLNLYTKDEKLTKLLEKMEEKVLGAHISLMTSIFNFGYLIFNAPRVEGKVMYLLDTSYNENKTMPDRIVVSRLVKHYTLALRRAATFRVYERLFSLWHILHIPLFFMMLLTAVIHVFSVHMY